MPRPLRVPSLLAAAPLALAPLHGIEDGTPAPAAPGDGSAASGLPAEPVLLPRPTDRDSAAARRARVAAALGDGALVLEAGPEPEGRFHPEDDFWWLTGVDVPDAALVLRAEGGEIAWERLYLPRKDPRFELWNGPRPAPGPESEELFGIAETRAIQSFEPDLVELLDAEVAIHGEGERVEAACAGRERALTDPEPMLDALQVVREPAELAAQRAAIDITQAGLVEAMRVALPGRFEYTAEAALEGTFRRLGAADLAFPSICGSGPNSCILHYRENERRLEPGDLLLLDVGAKYQHLCADVTRTIPVDGTFTERQREVYAIVYEASREAAAVLRPGATLAEAHAAAQEHLREAGYLEHFKHFVGHGLGMRVHDAPGREVPLAPGMVVTIEPGIYIAEEEIGIRIEDDWLITEDGAELLSDALPSHPDELEAFLAEIRGS